MVDSNRPPDGAASVDLFDDDEEMHTVVDQSSLRQPAEVPDYPPIATYGRYELLGRIAMGGMAEIFLARDRDDEGNVRHLVIKRVLPHVADDEDFIRMFLDEARIANRLYHPNVCHTYESGEIDGSYFMAMEWVHGVPLRKLIRRANDYQGVPVPIAAKAIALVAEALHYAHNAKDQHGQPLNIVHRDVSPHNIVVGFDGTVKLLDFGIAKAATQATRTQAGMVKGKYSYLSPEQCHGRAVDARSDVFALGICLYETVTGRPLYHRGSILNTMSAIVREDVPSARAVAPHVPEALDRIIQKALQKEPGERFQDAHRMRAALEQLLASQGHKVEPPQIAEVLDSLFHEEERRPLSGADAEGGGSDPQSSGGRDSDPLAGSGSFGPFGKAAEPPPAPAPAAARQAEPSDRVEIDVALEADAPPAPPPPPEPSDASRASSRLSTERLQAVRAPSPWRSKSVIIASVFVGLLAIAAATVVVLALQANP